MSGQMYYVFVSLLFFQVGLCCIEARTANHSDTTNNTSSQYKKEFKTANERRSLYLVTNSTSNLVELSEKGRFWRTYDIITCDGYILDVLRLTFRKDERKEDLFPVLLVHGLYQSADSFTEQSNDRSLALFLHSLGYDVWVANARGNRYGRNHIYFEEEGTSKADLFNYTYEEIGLYDIAATVDYILNDTSKEKLHYIGHSLGSTVFLVLNSMKPEFNVKFASAHLMAPIGYQKFFPDDDFLDVARNFNEIYEELLKQGKMEIFPHEAIHFGIELLRHGEQFAVDSCLGNETYKNICRKLKIDKLMGLREDKNSVYKIRGGSLKLLAHLMQNVKSKTFARWDYGKKGNEERYGTKEPPKYDLGRITAPARLIYSPNDEFVSPKDVADMAKDIANAKTRAVRIADYKHEDFIAAPNAMEVVYIDIIKDLRDMKTNT